MKKVLSYILVNLICVTTSFAQTWSWSYTAYFNGNQAGTGSVNLVRENNQFTVEFKSLSMIPCLQGKLPATVEVLENIINVTLSPTDKPPSNCTKILLSFSTDGKTGTRYNYPNNTPQLDKFDRQMVSQNPSDLPKLISLFKQGGSQTIQAQTPMPAPVPASANQPARSAAIGNVQTQAPATATAQGAVNQPARLTSNPIDSQRKTSRNDVWVSFNPSITVQERQFCRIIENFRTENEIAQQSKNQIKVNETLRNLSQSLNSLLPDGKFQGWIMRTVNVSQASDGSAEVLMELPCNVYVGSNACDANPANFYGTAPEGSRIYTELAKMTVGDFALTSGQFVYVDDKAYDKNRSVSSYRFLKSASHCKAKEMPIDSDFFGLKLDVISTIK